MFFMQTIRMCFKNILSNKLRSFLTMLGIIIGISSVIILVGFTKGTSDDINSSLNSLGANVITVNVLNDSSDSSYTLEYSEVKDLNYQFAKEVVLVNQSRTFARKDKNSGMFTVVGTTTNFLDVNDFSLSDGRNMAVLDLDNSSNIAILGYDTATTLFGNDDAVGEKILLGSNYYTVIGVLGDNSSSDSDYDSSIILPLTSFASLTEDTTVGTMYFVTNEENPNTTMIERMINMSLGSYISSDYLEVVTKDSVASTVSEVDEMTTILITLIGIISLFVSGIGVMNIMIVSVSERTREIGVRKAIGACDFDILKQFLIEAILLTTFGGLLGISIAYLFNIMSEFIGISFIIDSQIVIISLGFSVLIGIIFGIIPALRASKLKPIDALKYE